MIRIELQIDLNYEIDQNGADFVLNIHAAHTANQRVAAENFMVSQPVGTKMHTDQATGNPHAPHGVTLPQWPS